MRKFILIAGMTAALTGCEVGPDYKPPNITVRPDFAESASTQPSGAALASMKWWETFHDPVLNSLIARAVRGNLNLQTAGSRLRQARRSAGWWGRNFGRRLTRMRGIRTGEEARMW